MAEEREGVGASRGRRDRKSRGGPMDRGTLVSKKLSWLLRHGAASEGLTLGKGGYINLGDVLSNRKIKSLNPAPTFAEVKELVQSNDKQRFSLIHISSTPRTNTVAPDAGIDESASELPSSTFPADDADPKHYLIRANQGHSLDLDAADLLRPISLTAGKLPAIVVHGTRRENWPRILASGGLKPMGRNHVHFATGVPIPLQSEAMKQDIPALAATSGDTKALSEEQAAMSKDVVSGMRLSSTVLVFADLEKALNAGIKFWMSDNGVVLSEGDDRGLVPIEMFSRVEERGGRVLLRDGQVIAELEHEVRGR